MSNIIQLGTTVRDFLIVLNNSGQIDALFLDMVKAFDKASRSKLLYKLRLILLLSYLAEWVRGYLSSRTQSVDVIGAFLESVAVIFGFPQGSVLGSLLFLTYINDLIDAIP